MDLIRSWKHSGFNVDLERTLDPSSRDEIKQLGRYLLRAPVAENRLDYDRANQMVTVDVPDGNSVAMDVLDFISGVVLS